MNGCHQLCAFTARHGGRCAVCGEGIAAGVDRIRRDQSGNWGHARCVPCRYHQSNGPRDRGKTSFHPRSVGALPLPRPGPVGHVHSTGLP